MRITLAAASLTLLIAAPWAVAENASADLRPGEKLTGTIVTPGDEDRITVYLPGDCRVTVQMKQMKGSDLLPDLGLEDPDGDPVDPGAAWAVNGSGTKGNLKNFEVMDRGGDWVFLPRDAAEGDGRYELQVKKVVYVKKVRAEEMVDGQNNLSVSIDAPAGSTLDFAVKPSKKSEADPEVVSLDGPSGAIDVDASLKQRKISCEEDGTYTLRIKNAGLTAGGLRIDLKIKTPRNSRRVLYLSPDGFGEAPRIDLVEPGLGLDDRVAEDVVISGANFDAGAEVWLELGKEDPISPNSFTVNDDTSITATFDVVDVKTGNWKLMVLNPSGGADVAKFKVKGAGKVKLPRGIDSDAEVWFLDFDEDLFLEDLAAIGLGSTSSTVAEDAMDAVKNYALYWARVGMGQKGRKGVIKDDDVAVSFILERPTGSVGAPGSTYNRLHIGGGSVQGDQSSNPNYAWGNGPDDTGNATVDDISRDGGGADWGLFTRVLAAGGGEGVRANWTNDLAPIVTQPLTSSDAEFFRDKLVISSDEEAQRYKHVVTAINAVGKEIGGMIAHFVARATGLETGVGGLSRIPSEVGEFNDLTSWGFNSVERETLNDNVNPSDLPGSSGTLSADWMNLFDSAPFEMPLATATVPYEEFFDIVGGRPDRMDDDMTFIGAAGVLPVGIFPTSDGGVKGLAPLKIEGFIYCGTFLFAIRVSDKVADEDIVIVHQLTLLADEDNNALSPGEQAQAATKNAGLVD